MSSGPESRMMALFAGFPDAHGTHGATALNQVKGGKQEIKASARTVREPVTEALWADHIAGKRPLGIIPIRADGTCSWGAIDVDKYDVSLGDLAREILRHKLPLLVCRSKSGGAHMFLFLAAPAPVEQVQGRLREIATTLGVGGSEIFPKQTQVLLERGDLGNWLNMPYFGGDKTDRWCAKQSGLAMALVEFLGAAEKSVVPVEWLSKKVVARKDDDLLGEGPPCLQHLAATGFPEGSRNKGLFALGVLAKKKHPGNWQEKLEDMNRRFMSPPLPAEEVVQVVRSLEKKEYQYTCSDWPLAPHCNSILCRTRLHGIGGSDDYPVISGLSVLDTDPPLWFLDIAGERIEMTTEELQKYSAFQKVCMERLLVCFRLMKQDTWINMVGMAMKTAQRIEVPAEVGIHGQFQSLLEDFCLNRHRGQSLEDILLGRPWEDEEERRHYFRMRDLARFLEAAGFKNRTQSWMTERIRQMGGGHKFYNIKGKGVNTWWVPSNFVPMPSIAVPAVRGSPI